jgi:acyl-CoA synthetase (AMP-forming)/AMP-acid ligase II
VAPYAEVVAVYGSTEAEPICHIALSQISGHDRELMRGGAGLLAGEPIHDIELAILPNRFATPIGPFNHEDFMAERCAADTAGEIVVHGPHVLKGYAEGRGDMETKFRVGSDVWHRTGDLGYRDPEGRLWLLGRASAAISGADGVLYPFAVECAAKCSADITRSALVEVGGKRILLVEGPPGGGGPDLAALMAKLAWAGLDEVRAIEKIPVDPRHNAKVDYVRLRQILEP